MTGHHRIGAVVLTTLVLCFSFSAGSRSQEPVTVETIETWMEELSNWGRWGKEDQMGTLNLITPAKRKEAARLVKEGVSVSLSRPADKVKGIENPSPWGQEMRGVGSGAFAMDTYTINYHGFAHTHLDALCHFAYKGRMYNGFSSESVQPEGCGKLGVEHLREGIVTRGVLIDIPRLEGVDYLAPGTAIYAKDLDAWEKKTGVTVRSGDAVFIRTGRWARRAAEGPWDIAKSGAGVHVSAARWFKERDVAVVGSDFGTDVAPSGVEGARFPLHQLLLVAMGTPLFDNCDLEAVSREANARGRWDFLLTVAPLSVPGGTGSPVNPIATF